MKILTQNLKNGNTKIYEVPSPANTSKKIQVINHFSLISTGTESSIVNFGKVSWLGKVRQQPDKVKDVVNKLKSSGVVETFNAIKNKLDSPMVMGYSSVGRVKNDNNKFNIKKGTRIFTNSPHQEEALVDYNMCIKIPDNVDDKSACFGAMGGIAMQSIKCVPKDAKTIAIIGLGLLGQITLRVLLAMGFKCIVYDLDDKKIRLAEKYGAIGAYKNNLLEIVHENTKGLGADCTIIAAASNSSQIINNATKFTKRKGKIVSSGVVGLNLIRDNFFKKQIGLVVSNSSGDKNHKGEGSSYENIKHFFQLISSKKIKVLDLISEETSFTDVDNIYSFPDESLFFSKIIKYNYEEIIDNNTMTKDYKKSQKLNIGLIGTGNFATSTLIPLISKSKDGEVYSLLGREGLPLYSAQKKFKINTITTNESDFLKNIEAVFISTPHETHYDFLNRYIDYALPIWVEKPLVISIEELILITNKMLSNEQIYAVGFNRSFAPWTKVAKKIINGKKSDIKMTINAGELPSEHWLLNKKKCGGRILGECCHFIDLSLTLLSHTTLKTVKCISRDYHYQDTGEYILSFEDGSTVSINYTHKLPPSLPKEKISVVLSDNKLVNNNWRKFSSNKIFDFNFIKKGKGHKEAINEFFNRIKSDKYLSKSEINAISFSTFVSIKLQAMRFGESLDFSNLFNDEILSNQLDL